MTAETIPREQERKGDERMNLQMEEERVISPTPIIEPMDAFNQRLMLNVHPSDWQNPSYSGRYNIVVVGGGTAGLVTASIAAGLGAKVALIERHFLGGDCLNVGCVPSKAIIRASRVAAECRRAPDFGVGAAVDPNIDFGQVMERMRRLRSQISPNDSATRYRDLGVDVYFGDAQFIGLDEIRVGDRELRFKKAVIATGARAAHPPIEGLKEAGYLTNETIFSLVERPRHLAVVGGGPIGCELAQAFRRLGSRVTIIEGAPQFLPREDPEAAAVLSKAFARDDIHVRLGTQVKRVEKTRDGTVIHLQTDGTEDTLVVDSILVGVGRTPNVDSMGLEAAGVKFDRQKGVSVDDFLRTSNSNIYAAGDVCSRFKFTHTADFAARIVIQNALFPFLPKRKFSSLVIPWCTYTDPEIAHVGAYAQELEDRGETFDTLTVHFSDVDRAILDGDDEGFLKVYVDPKGVILGGTLVASHAGDMISELTLAMVGGLKIGSLGNTIHPYPTQAEALRKAADLYNRKRLTPGRKKILARLMSALR